MKKVPVIWYDSAAPLPVGQPVILDTGDSQPASTRYVNIVSVPEKDGKAELDLLPSFACWRHAPVKAYDVAVDISDAAKGCALANLFVEQFCLNSKYGVDTSTFNTRESTTEWLLKYNRALTQEQAELVDSIPFKHWRPEGVQPFDLQNVGVELTDTLFFLISQFQTAGFNARDVIALYSKKLGINVGRADTGYLTKGAEDAAANKTVTA